MNKPLKHPPVIKPFVHIAEVLETIMDDLGLGECEPEPTPMISGTRDSKDA